MLDFQKQQQSTQTMQQQIPSTTPSVTSTPSVQPMSKTVLNRRYAKMIELKNKSDYFSLESIKFRHPELFAVYIGNRDISPHQQPTLTGIFEKALMNCEYKQLLQNKESQFQQEQQQQQIEQQGQEYSNQQIIFNNNMLVSLAEKMFIQGKNTDVDYGMIDNDEQFDSSQFRDQDDEQRYFCQDAGEEEPCSDTGVQDF